jgi:Predicted oxidoreductases of the aldo/keto reductase family
MKNINRRKFLSLSALAGAGALVAPQLSTAAVASRPSSSQNEKKTIPTRILGKTGLEIPILSMGVMRADNPAVVRAAYNSGLTHFDTAHGYQNGKNEEMLGNFFKDKDRSTFTVATKARLEPNSENFETEYENMLDISLRRLQMDYVDIFYVHGPNDNETLTNPRMIKTLNKFKVAGKVKHIGFSTHANKPEQIDAAIEAGIYEVCLVSYNFTLEVLQELEEAMQRGVEAGMGFVAMKTMAGGVEDANGEKQVDGAACLRWAWQNPNLTTAIPGFTSFDLLENCLEAAYRPEMNEDDVRYIAALGGCDLLYCQNCEKCVTDCSKSLPIPDIMRAYMYNFGYKHPSLSKDTLMELVLSGRECNNCVVCTVSCPQGFKVAEKIAAITPIMHVPNEYLT